MTADSDGMLEHIQRPSLACVLILLCGTYVTAQHARPDDRIVPLFAENGATLSVPKIIHQSWKDEHVPQRFERWQKSWQKTHPDWKYTFWTVAENRELVKNHYPWFLDTYENLPVAIMKADSARYLYMHAYGGMYADLDYEAVRNMEDLLQGHSVYLADMNSEQKLEGENAALQQLVPNAWMASVPYHPFWLLCLQRVIRNAGYIEGYRDAEMDMGRKETMRRMAVGEHITGPSVMTEALAVAEKLGGQGVHVLPTKQLYPFHWLMTDPQWGGEDYDVCDVRNEAFNDDECKKLFPEAYAITYWTHSWS